MNQFNIQKTRLNGAYLIEYFYSGDTRGSFSKIFERDNYLQSKIDFTLNETFVSVSSKSVLRGLHFQLNNPQAKIVSVIGGRAWDVIVDLRKDSSTYKEWEAIELSGENHKAVYVPRGFAHGFVALEDNTIMLYQCEGKYDKDTDTGIIFNDKTIGVKWPVDTNATIHSQRDLSLMSFEEYDRNPMRI